MKEQWRPIAGHLGYEVSNRGRVRSLSRWVEWRACHRARAYRRFLRGMVLRSIWNQTTGYAQVLLTQRFLASVHRVVAIAFLGPPPFPKAQVNHIDNNRRNNKLPNLEWTTPKQNQQHSWQTTDRVGPCVGVFSGKHPTAIPVIATCMKTGKQKHYAAAMDAVRAGFRSDAISRACAGKIAHHKGCRWSYAGSHQGRTQDRNAPRFLGAE